MTLTEAPDPAEPPEPARAPRTIIYRPWQPGDSPEEVTDLLHRAFARLAGMGIPCASSHQPPPQTLARIERGNSFVAIESGRIVGTISVYGAELDADTGVYREPDVASVHQFAVDPAYQGLGVGDALLRLAECKAKLEGYKALALDTPQPAEHLHAFYLRQGFRIVEAIRFKGREYLSVVLTKALAPETGRAPALAWI